MTGLRIAVVAGGPSSEAAVSRVSALGVQRALAQTDHAPTILELEAELPARLEALAADVVFPVTHGRLGEDGCLQGMLEVLGMAYVGSGVLASALAADKPSAKVQLKAAGLPVAADAVVWRGQGVPEEARRLRRELGAALVVKPAGGGSAIGVTRVAADASDAVLVAALEAALGLDSAALVEEFVAGRELTCGVLEEGAATARALPVTEILSRAADWYDFTSKYAAGGSEHRCPASLAPALTEQVQSLSVAVFRALGARDLGRVDLILRPSGELVVLELNTLPGMTATSLFPEAAQAAGIGFAELCHRLVRRAYERPRREVPVAMPMPV